MKVAWTALLFLIPFVALFWALFRKKETPAIFYSSSGLVKAKEKVSAPPFFLLSLALLSLALLDPHFETVNKAVLNPKTAPALYFVLDRSGSMAQGNRMEMLKEVTEKYALSKEREGDAIGLVAFARTAEILSPLTFDREAIVDRLRALTPVKKQSDDGTAIGYAIYKTASLIALSQGAKNAAILVVTDGIQLPNPADKGNRLRSMTLQEAAAFAEEQRIPVYIVSIDPALTEGEFAPIGREMEEAAARTGGKFFVSTDLSPIYKEIDTLAFSEIRGGQPPISYRGRGFSFYPYLILLSLLSLCGGVFWETVKERRVP